jgi:hypothetical protein
MRNHGFRGQFPARSLTQQADQLGSHQDRKERTKTPAAVWVNSRIAAR